MHIHVNGDSEKFKELESKGLLSTTLNQVKQCLPQYMFFEDFY